MNENRTVILKEYEIIRNIKLKIYKSIIRSIVTYAAEMINLSSQKEEQLRTHERNIMWILYIITNKIKNEYHSGISNEIKKKLKKVRSKFK